MTPLLFFTILKVGYDKGGLPVGIQFIGRPWSEATLLHLAYAMQVSTAKWLRSSTGAPGCVAGVLDRSIYFSERSGFVVVLSMQETCSKNYRKPMVHYNLLRKEC
jgi:hypothetical protein